MEEMNHPSVFSLSVALFPTPSWGQRWPSHLDTVHPKMDSHGVYIIITAQASSLLPRNLQTTIARKHQGNPQPVKDSWKCLPAPSSVAGELPYSVQEDSPIYLYIILYEFIWVYMGLWGGRHGRGIYIC